VRVAILIQGDNDLYLEAGWVYGPTGALRVGCIYLRRKLDRNLSMFV